MSERVHLLYDYLQVRGGAEAAMLRLRDAWPASELLVASINPEQFPKPGLERVRALHRHQPRSRVFRVLQAVRAFSHLPRQSNVSGALFSGHFAPLAWASYPSARRVLFLHGPPFPFYFDRNDPSLGALPDWLRDPVRALMWPLGSRYRRAVDAMDAVVANSAETASHCRHWLGRDCRVVAPPVDPGFFAVEPTAAPNSWLSFARHEPRKRIHLLIEAFRLLPDHSLLIAGAGTQTETLRRQANGLDNVRFVGVKDVAGLCALLADVRGTAHLARDEPFGLVVAESLAAGKPVVVAGQQGAAAWIRDGWNGWRVEEHATAAEVAAAVLACEKASPSANDCRRSAERSAVQEVARCLADALKGDVASH